MLPQIAHSPPTGPSAPKQHSPGGQGFKKSQNLVSGCFSKKIGFDQFQFKMKAIGQDNFIAEEIDTLVSRRARLHTSMTTSILSEEFLYQLWNGLFAVV